MEKLLLAVPAVLGIVAVGAAAASGTVPVTAVVPGVLVLAVFAGGMYAVARRRGPDEVDSEVGVTDAAGVGAATDGGEEATGATAPGPLVRRANEVTYEDVDAADGMRKGVLVGEADGAPTLAIRRFVLGPGATVPRHTNEIEHEQYVLEGEYTVGIGEEEYEVSAGDSLLIPAGTVHWYRNDGPGQGAFICAVPTGDDRIELVE
jgi:quercetin dioxygenase-like cupin family protein